MYSFNYYTLFKIISQYITKKNKKLPGEFILAGLH